MFWCPWWKYICPTLSYLFCWLNFIVIENIISFVVLMNIIPIDRIIEWHVCFLNYINISSAYDRQWYGLVSSLSYCLFTWRKSFYGYYSLVLLILKRINIFRNEIWWLATNFSAPKLNYSVSSTLLKTM